MNTKLTTLLGSALLCIPLLAIAAPKVPDSGLKAEMAGRWQDAITIYRQTLKSHPGQAHLWVRIAEIQASQNDADGAIKSLQQAATIEPRNADIYYRLSQLYAAREEKQAALKASSRAVELSPNNPDYLKARASHANWNGDYALAQKSYRTVLAKHPKDDEALLGLARSSMWLRDHDAAASAYRSYLARHPGDADTTLELMEVEAERGNYDAAKKLGEEYRRRHGESAEYWLRAADLYALSGNDRAAAEALRKAASYNPDDAALYYRIARSYPEKADQPSAMAAIERALELEPENLEYWRARADLASWVGDYPKALESHQRILAIDPDDSGALLGIARVNAWQGESDAAIKAYKRYLAKHPKVQVVWAEYIQLEMEVGNYAYVLEQLEHYRSLFGETKEYVNLKARTYAWAQRPAKAMPLVEQRLSESPDDYDMNYTRTIALNNDHRPAEAVASIDKLIELRPDSKDTADIQKYITTPLRSRVSLNGGYQEDSNDIVERHYGAEGVYAYSPQTSFSIAGAHHAWQAPSGSGYEAISGDTEATYQQLELGAQHLVNSRLSLDARAGSASITDGDDHNVYEVGMDIWPMDGMSLRLSHSEQPYAVSPRTVSLEIMRTNSQLDLTWSPNLLYTIDAMVSTSSLSDDNTRNEVQLAPRRAVLRNQRWSIDVGLSAQWLGYDTDPGNGYYAPEHYERVALNGYFYRKFGEENALSLIASAGGYKDNTINDVGFSGSLSAEAYIGIYSDWMLDVQAGMFENSGIDTGAYRVNNIEITLTKRF